MGYCGDVDYCFCLLMSVVGFWSKHIPNVPNVFCADLTLTSTMVSVDCVKINTALKAKFVNGAVWGEGVAHAPLTADHIVAAAVRVSSFSVVRATMGAVTCVWSL